MVKPASKPIVSEEEKRYRDEMYPDIKKIKNKNILCTSCNGSLKELILKGKPKTHPFLDTLLCEKCNAFFGDGEFSLDEDGSDKYCRWCGQGGTLYLCSTCSAGFCKKCVKRNLPRAALREVENDDWQCFCCNVKPLYELRAHCWAANKFAVEVVKNEDGRKRKYRKSEEQEESSSSNESETSGPKKKRKYDSSDNEEEPTTPRTRRSGRKRKIQSEDNKSTKSGKQNKDNSKEKSKIFKPMVAKLSATIKDALSMTELFKKKVNDCSNKKINLNYMKSVENVAQVCNKVDTLLQSVESISHQLRTSVKDYHKKWEQSLQEKSKDTKENDNDEKEINGIEGENKNVEEDTSEPANSKTLVEEEQSDDEYVAKTVDQDNVKAESNNKKDGNSDTFSDIDAEDKSNATNANITEVKEETKASVEDKAKDVLEDKDDDSPVEKEGDETDRQFMECDNDKDESLKRKLSTDEDVSTKESPSSKGLKDVVEDD